MVERELCGTALPELLIPAAIECEQRHSAAECDESQYVTLRQYNARI